MRTNIARIVQSTRQAIRGKKGAATDVLVTAREWPVDSTVDPVTQSRSGTPITRALRTRALLHFPQPTSNSAVRQFNEVEAGDCIADFEGSVDLDNRQDLTFLFLKKDGTPMDGILWVPKQNSDRLARIWGTLVQGKRIFRTVLLRKATGGDSPVIPDGQTRAWDPLAPPWPDTIDGGPVDRPHLTIAINRPRPWDPLPPKPPTELDGGSVGDDPLTEVDGGAPSSLPLPTNIDGGAPLNQLPTDIDGGTP